jgi:hypothetical protein
LLIGLVAIIADCPDYDLLDLVGDFAGATAPVAKKYSRFNMQTQSSRTSITTRSSGKCKTACFMNLTAMETNGRHGDCCM